MASPVARPLAPNTNRTQYSRPGLMEQSGLRDPKERTIHLFGKTSKYRGLLYTRSTTAQSPQKNLRKRGGCWVPLSAVISSNGGFLVTRCDPPCKRVCSGSVSICRAGLVGILQRDIVRTFLSGHELEQPGWSECCPFGFPIANRLEVFVGLAGHD